MEDSMQEPVLVIKSEFHSEPELDSEQESTESFNESNELQEPEMIILQEFHSESEQANFVDNEENTTNADSGENKKSLKTITLPFISNLLTAKDLFINNVHLCPLCGEMMKTKQMLEHALLHCEEKRVCFLCLKDFRCNSKLKWHVKVIHMGTKEYICNVCNKIFPRQGNLTEHMKIHNGDKKHKCTVCPKTFSTNSMLVRHMKIHTEEKDYICPVCNKGFVQKGNLLKHKCLQSEGRNYVCSVCNKTYKGKYNLAVHAKIHGDRKTFDCPYCSKVFFATHKVKEHIKRMHRHEITDGSMPERVPVEKKYKCTECGTKAYTSKGALDYHMISAHPDLIDQNIQHFFQCDVCNKILTGKHSFIRHVKTHSLKKTLKCHFCEKKYATNTLLRNHEKLHSVENKYVCSICNRGFPLKSYLSRHEKIHMNEKKFQCSTCGEMFVSNSKLQIHLDVHPGTKMFECEICSKEFSNKSRLTRHKRTVHRKRKKIVCKKESDEESDGDSGERGILSEDENFHVKEKLLTFSL